MKNIHLIPTDKPSRLILQNTKLLLSKYKEVNEGFSEFNQNIYITSDEEIKEGDCFINTANNFINIASEEDKDLNFFNNVKKIILTTDQDLIKDGVQAIDDEFLEWFVKNPSCEEVETFIFGFDDSIISHSKKYEIIIPKEEPKQEYICYKCGNKTNNKFEICDKCNVGWKEPKQETLEEAAFRLFPRLINDPYNPMEDDNEESREDFIDGAKWQAERMYSEEDMKSAFFNGGDMKDIEEFNYWFKQFKKK
jgi:hypothetical protein